MGRARPGPLRGPVPGPSRGANRRRWARVLRAAAAPPRATRPSACRFLGVRTGSSEVLYKAVDTTEFTPAQRPSRPRTLLLGGNQYQRYRVETALETLAALPDVRLLVAGRLSFAPTEADAHRSF